MQIAAYTEDQRLVSEMSGAGYSKDEITFLFGQISEAPVLRVLFEEAQNQNDFGNYRTSYALLAHKVKTHATKPGPDQPLTWEQLERQMSVISDPLEMLTPEFFRENAYLGRVHMVSYKVHVALMKEYGAECVLEALRDLPHLPHDSMDQIAVDRFQEMLEQAKKDKNWDAVS